LAGSPIPHQPIILNSDTDKVRAISNDAGIAVFGSIRPGSYRPQIDGPDYLAAGVGGRTPGVTIRASETEPIVLRALPVLIAGAIVVGEMPSNFRFAWDSPIREIAADQFDQQDYLNVHNKLKNDYGPHTSIITPRTEGRITGTLSLLFVHRGIYGCPVEMVRPSQFHPCTIDAAGVRIDPSTVPGVVRVLAYTPSGREVSLGQVAISRLERLSGFQHFLASCGERTYLPPGAYKVTFGPADCEYLVKSNPQAYRFTLSPESQVDVRLETVVECATTRWSAVPKDHPPLALRFGFLIGQEKASWSATRYITQRDVEICLPIGQVLVARVNSVDAESNQFIYTTISVTDQRTAVQVFDSLAVEGACRPYAPGAMLEQRK
jgi:hypothetical protein